MSELSSQLRVSGAALAAAPEASLDSPTAASPARGPSLLDLALLQAPGGGRPESDHVAAFLAEQDPFLAILLWLGLDVQRVAKLGRRALLDMLDHDILHLDNLLSEQVNAIMHHPRFQGLEASWRGLQYLLDRVEESSASDYRASVTIRLLHAPWGELSRDFEDAVDFDRSSMFQRIYNDEFGVFGGHPFGLLIGDYQVRHRPSEEHPYDDIATLRSISRVAASAFVPFVTGADPALFGLKHISQLATVNDLPAVFEQAEYTKWNSFRATDDAKFVGLVLPRVLLRAPYENDGSRADGFRFEETVDDGDFLWGHAGYALAGTVVRAMSGTGWPADIRGFRRKDAQDEEPGPGVEIGGGLVTGLPAWAFRCDPRARYPRYPTEVVLPDGQERQLEDLGFIPMTYCKDTEYCVFHAVPSVHRPKGFAGPESAAAKASERLSSMLQYVLCASRFAHYLKVMAREKLGKLASAEDLEDFLRRWLVEYVSPSPDEPERPLAGGDVRITEAPNRPGTYLCTMDLQPHFQLDAMGGKLSLRTRLVGQK